MQAKSLQGDAYLYEMGIGAKEHTQTGAPSADVTVTHVFPHKIKS